MEKRIGLPKDRIRELRSSLHHYEQVQAGKVRESHGIDTRTNAKSVVDFSDRSSWNRFDENQTEISKDFKGVLGESLDINEFLFFRFPGREDLVLIEVGGPGYGLRASMPQVARSYAICLEDKDIYNYSSKILDPTSHTVVSRVSVNNQQVPADLTQPETFRELSRVMSGTKADVLIERMYRGWKYIYQKPEVLFHILNKYYKLMSDNSVMFIQLIYKHPTDMEKFSEFINQVNLKFLGKLKIKFIKLSGMNYHYTLLIEKFPGCPKELTSLRQNKTYQHEH